MAKVSKTMVEIRIDLLKQMHKYVIEMGDEYLYDTWIISAVPDEPSDNDFEDIANDDDYWVHACHVFSRIAFEDLKENY